MHYIIRAPPYLGQGQVHGTKCSFLWAEWGRSHRIRGPLRSCSHRAGAARPRRCPIYLRLHEPQARSGPGGLNHHGGRLLARRERQFRGRGMALNAPPSWSTIPVHLAKSPKTAVPLFHRQSNIEDRLGNATYALPDHPSTSRLRDSPRHWFCKRLPHVPFYLCHSFFSPSHPTTADFVTLLDGRKVPTSPS